MYVLYKSVTSSTPHMFHMRGVSCPHAGVQVIMCTCVYKSVHTCVDYARVAYWAVDTCVSIVITILQMAMLCKCNNPLNHWFLSAKQSRDCIPLLNSHRIVIFSNSAIELYSSVNQSSDIQPIWRQYSSTKQHWIIFFRNVTNYMISGLSSYLS